MYIFFPLCVHIYTKIPQIVWVTDVKMRIFFLYGLQIFKLHLIYPKQLHQDVPLGSF